MSSDLAGKMETLSELKLVHIPNAHLL